MFQQLLLMSLFLRQNNTRKMYCLIRKYLYFYLNRCAITVVAGFAHEFFINTVIHYEIDIAFWLVQVVFAVVI